MLGCGRIQHVADDGTRGPVHELSPEACARSLTLASVMMKEALEPAPDAAPRAEAWGHDDVVMEVRAPHATPRSLATVVRFIDQGAMVHRPGHGAPPLPKPLWHGGRAPTSLRSCTSLAEEERALVEQFEGDVKLLVEVTRTADFLQVDELLDLCCAVLAVMIWRADGDVEDELELESLPVMVLIRVLTFVPAVQQGEALAKYSCVRDEVCLFAVERWFADLASMAFVQDQSTRPWRMCVKALALDGVQDVAMEWLLNEAAAFMKEEGFVPPQLTAERLSEQLESVLSVAQFGARGPDAAMVGVFDEALTGPLGKWLPLVAMPRLELTQQRWCVTRFPSTQPFAPSASGVMVVHKAMPTDALQCVTQHAGAQLNLLRTLWQSTDSAVSRVAVWNGGSTMVLIAAQRDTTVRRMALAETSLREASALGVLADRLVIAGTGSRTLSHATDLDLTGMSSHITTGPYCRATHVERSAFSGFPWADLRSVSLSHSRGILSIASHFGSGSGVVSVDLRECTAVEVGDNFLANCRSLVSVTLPNGLQRLGDRAFVQCVQLKTVDASRCDQLTSIGSHLCAESGVTEMNLSACKALSSIGDHLGSACPMLTSASLPSGLSRLADHAFAKCAVLNHVDLTECRELDSIGPHFAAGSGLRTLDMRQWAATTIGDFLLALCANLESVTLPDGLKRLAKGAFFRCGQLKTVDASGCDQLTSIGSYFCAESGVTEMNLSACKALSSIGDSLCARCPNLLSAALCSGLKRIGYDAFLSCERLTQLDLTQCVSLVTCGDNFCVRTGLSTLAMSDCATLVTIGVRMCAACPNLSTVSMPHGLEHLGAEAFFKCTALTSLDLLASHHGAVCSEVHARTCAAGALCPSITDPTTVGNV